MGFHFTQIKDGIGFNNRRDDVKMLGDHPIGIRHRPGGRIPVDFDTGLLGGPQHTAGAINFVQNFGGISIAATG